MNEEFFTAWTKAVRGLGRRRGDARRRGHQEDAIVAEKIRACYKRSKACDIIDPSNHATRPLNAPLIRRLVVLKR